MVYLREIISRNRKKLLKLCNLETVAYLFLTNRNQLALIEYDFSPEEEIAFSGYQGSKVNINDVVSILSKRPIKGISARANIYKFTGLFLAAKEELKEEMKSKYSQSDLKQKYFISKIDNTFAVQLRESLNDYKSDPFYFILKNIITDERIEEDILDNALEGILENISDVQTQIIIEDLEKELIKIKFNNKDTEEILKDVFSNFSNALQKIITGRRKDHAPFVINDEYDVQDILYVILKSYFPNLRDEDPIPKVGSKSTKIDLILRDENILIEVKMIKESDSNETKFIEELKVDFESYHECKWLKKLFCFIYDPFNKTRDISNFKDLTGLRQKGAHQYAVEVFVIS